MLWLNSTAMSASSQVGDDDDVVDEVVVVAPHRQQRLAHLILFVAREIVHHQHFKVRALFDSARGVVLHLRGDAGLDIIDLAKDFADRTAAVVVAFEQTGDARGAAGQRLVPALVKGAAKVGAHLLAGEGPVTLDLLEHAQASSDTSVAQLGRPASARSPPAPVAV